MLEFMNTVSREAGEESLRYFGNLNAGDVCGKSSDKDLVSIADKAVEKLIISKISARFPEHDILGEESGHAGKKSEFCWVIDPIDGTQSFVKHHPYYSVSIGLYKNGKPYAGVVNAPALNRIYCAQQGMGAFENGRAIQVSNCEKLEEAFCTTGFARLRENNVEPVLTVFQRIVPNLRAINRCGSAALDMCMTAAGIYDGYWEDGLQLYDVAAGIIIALEAGAVVCDYNGNENFPADGIIAGTPRIANGLLELIREK